MTGFPQPSAETTAVWTRLVRASTYLLGRIEADLKAAGFPPLGWYDALWELEQAEPEGIRPFQLQARLLLPQYGLSRLIERMARDGLVERRGVESDRRGQVLHLTDRGLATRRAMWPVYATALDRAVAQRLDRSEAQELARLLARLYPPRSPD
jgi:DNA-binding MarR family transcriptional regulator